MHTPAAALAWELWRKHRKRLITIIGLILAFALVYPKLCAMAGFNSNSPDAAEEILKKFGLAANSKSAPGQVLEVACLIMFLTCGPAMTMIMTLLFVTWVFTFTEPDPKTKDPMTFPVRLFTLPVSTPFLFWSIFLAGMAAIVVLYESWVCLVPLPHLKPFAVYQNCLGWMTVLALAQGIVWSLAAWPITRMLILSAGFFGFTCSPAQVDIFESPFLLPSLFLLGLVLARTGLQKMRHGQWQAWTWRRPFPGLAARAEMRGPKRFASPAQAQLWFEWRWFARRSCFIVAALAVVPVVIHLLVRVAARLGPLQGDTMEGFTMYLLGVPLLIYFLFAVSPGQTDQSFLMVRPLTNGEMAMAILKAAAIGTAFSWVAVFVALGAMPLLGDFHAVEQSVSARAALVIGLIFLTWRLVAVNLCFVLTGKRSLAVVPVWTMVAVVAGAIFLKLSEEYWIPFVRFIPGLLACLVAVKFLLAFLAFRVSLKRRLLAPSMVGYLAVWILLVGALLTTLLVLSRPDKELIFPLSLGIVLLVPLARIGFCPVALGWNRHT